MSIEKKREFLINAAYWVLVTALAYLVCQYLLPIVAPILIGVLVARLVVALSRRLHCPRKWLRICLTLLIYGGVGVAVALAAARSVSFLSGLVAWLPEVYRLKLVPAANVTYQWVMEQMEALNPTMLKAVELAAQSVISGLQSLVTALSSSAVDLVSGVAKGVPKLLLSLLAMIFSTVFVSNDYEHLRAFAGSHMTPAVKNFLHSLKSYLTGTLLVVIRSYLLIMLLTFTELSLFFSIFRISNPLAKAALIAVLDILPILGTGSILIPWAITSLVLGYTGLGIELLVTYGIVTVVRNYAEPKIVGAQLGLHPIITLVSMFVGLRLFGFWGVFGLPIAISFAWKYMAQKREAL
ncbi:MAG: AI-2E family transporter [Eubacteriales bacterium]|nr:AI-2E family transporter [Eubacteriales bacterium]